MPLAEHELFRKSTWLHKEGGTATANAVPMEVDMRAEPILGRQGSTVGPMKLHLKATCLGRQDLSSLSPSPSPSEWEQPPLPSIPP